MPEIRLELLIHAKPETCFALLRDPRLHTETRVFVEGELGLGQRVRFESEMLGIKQVLVVEVTEFELGRLVTDTMVSGTFREFRHVHEFIPRRGGTLMRDTLIWRSPMGPLGAMTDALFVKARLTRLVSGRNARLKELAEAAA